MDADVPPPTPPQIPPPPPPAPPARPVRPRTLDQAERVIEFSLLASRWLLLPLYVILMAVLAIFGINAAEELWHLAEDIGHISEAELILSALSLIDLALVASLIVMVALSGYETFVSRFDTTGEMEQPQWLGKLDLGTVKLKLAASIVAISGIHLLKQYMTTEPLPNERLLTLAGVHLAFVASALLLAWVDRMSFSGHRH
ncbi:TIGR00645 family protein [Sporichthya polymorpha]|uniref:TIGR00645 family protein n=1 Tax=Sporichthya polymorpha TaxID=35751 RepID=UPI00035DC72C|nr:TIGR00645 family protein [Sporichthya polymorpha]